MALRMETLKFAPERVSMVKQFLLFR